jgi:hypothetical protein
MSFVVHGLAEALIETDVAASKIRFPLQTLPSRSMGRRLSRASPNEWPQMLWRGIRLSIMKINFVRKALGIKNADVRAVMEADHSIDYHYIFLSPHAARNAKVNLPIARCEAFSVTMPVKLREPRPPARNEFAKFAAYGNADALALHNIASAVHARRPRARYEIRLISGNHFSVDGIPNTTCVGKWGQKIDVEEMETQAEDIDIILMLFDENCYRVTCSGVLFEALSLIKPIMHFQNECVDEFNTARTPIGVRCTSFEDYIDRMVDIIENYDDRQKDLARYRNGILMQREALLAQNAEAAMRKSFEW